MITVGLTGGIASGKSVVSQILAECGAYIIDTDIVSREVMATGTATDTALRKRFPTAYESGELDRRVLKNIVFNDTASLRALNAITHPPIVKVVEGRLCTCTAPVAVVVAPLLYEVGLDKIVDLVINVTADPELRIRRLVKRDTITVDLARAILDKQLEEGERSRRADVVIENNGDVKTLRDEVKVLFNQIAERA